MFKIEYFTREWVEHMSVKYPFSTRVVHFTIRQPLFLSIRQESTLGRSPIICNAENKSPSSQRRSQGWPGGPKHMSEPHQGLPELF